MVDPVSYSVIQRCIGKLEGIGFCLPDDIRQYYKGVIAQLSDTVEQLREESDESENCEAPAP